MDHEDEEAALFDRAAANLPRVHLVPLSELSVLDIMKRKNLIVTVPSAEMLSARLNPL